MAAAATNARPQPRTWQLPPRAAATGVRHPVHSRRTILGDDGAVMPPEDVDAQAAGCGLQELSRLHRRHGREIVHEQCAAVAEADPRVSLHVLPARGARRRNADLHEPGRRCARSCGRERFHPAADSGSSVRFRVKRRPWRKRAKNAYGAISNAPTPRSWAGAYPARPRKRFAPLGLPEIVQPDGCSSAAAHL